MTDTPIATSVDALAGPGGGDEGKSGLPLLERDWELRALARALDLAVEGRGSLVVVEGPPGIGKTSLLGWAAAIAAGRGMTALHARGSEVEWAFPYGVARQLLEPALRAAPAERERLFGGGEGGGDLDRLDDLHRLILDLAGERPLLLAVDDLQWADAASLRFVSYLARRLSDIGAAVCVALRPPGREAESELLDHLIAEAAAESLLLQPGPLGESGSTRLLCELLGREPDADFAAACWAATSGNPLFLRELCRGLEAGEVAPVAANSGAIEAVGAESVAASVRLRLAQLPPDATDLARAAAVFGDGARIDDAGRLANLSERESAAMLDALCRQEILRDGTRVDFVHPLVREALYVGIGAGGAAQRHAAAAAVLAARGAAATSVAEQLLRASPAADPGRVATLREAAAEALGVGNGEAAVAYLRRALEEPPSDRDRAALLVALARAEALVDGPAAAAHMEEALALLSEPLARAGVAAGLATLLPSIDPDRGVEVGLTAIAELGDREPELRRRLETIAFTGALLSERPDLPLNRLAPTATPTPDGEPGWRMLACATHFRRARENAPAAEVAPAVRRALSGDWAMHSDVAGAQYVLGMLTLIAADHPDVPALCDQWQAAGRRLGRLGAFIGGQMFRAHARLARGELNGAANEARAALETMRDYRMQGGPVAYVAATLTDASLASGDLDAARAALALADRTPGEPSSVRLHGIELSRARLGARSGDRRSAYGDLLSLGERFEAIGGRNPALLPWRSMAATLAREEGEEDRARELAAAELELARAWGAPRALGRALTIAALVGDGEGDRRRLLEEAVAVLEPSPARLELAEAQLALGTEQRRGGAEESARETLSSALELAAACGAAPLEQRAREELAAAGARPRRAAVSGPEALTERERCVAELAATGASNREIADQLVISLRTVEAHLSRAYRKLGIESRSQLPAVLAGGPQT